jgi:hypothetical protein
MLFYTSSEIPVSKSQYSTSLSPQVIDAGIPDYPPAQPLRMAAETSLQISLMSYLVRPSLLLCYRYQIEVGKPQILRFRELGFATLLEALSTSTATSSIILRHENA